MDGQAEAAKGAKGFGGGGAVIISGTQTLAKIAVHGEVARGWVRAGPPTHYKVPLNIAKCTHTPTAISNYRHCC